MTTPEDRFYNPARINFWFAVASVLALAGGAGAILKDYAARDWKSYQEGFFAIERERAEKAIALKSASADGAARALVWAGGDASAGVLDKAAFERAVESAAEDADTFPRVAAGAAGLYLEESKRLAEDTTLVAEAETLRQAVTDAENARARAEMDQRSLKSDVDERKFQMEHARQHGHDAEYEALRKEWTELVAKEAEVHALMDAKALERDAAKQALKDCRAAVLLAEDRANLLFDRAGVAPAERRLGAFSFAALRDAPFLEVLAPVKRIQQRVVSELPVDLPFGKVTRVDRCETCHMGIDKVRIDPDTGLVTPLYTAENTPDRVYRTHPRPDLYVVSASPHPVDKFGCTVCHEGQGYGLNFNSAYHMPSTPEQEAEWEEKYHWHKGESWDYPMLPLRYIEASCAKCHRPAKGTDDLYTFRRDVPAAPKWNRGKRLVEQSGCYGCHKIDGYAVKGLDKEVTDHADPAVRAERLASSMKKAGPALGRIASKLPSREAAFKWIWDPKSLRPTSNMPRLFGQVNNSGIDPVTGEDYSLRTRTEVQGIVEYLWQSSEKWEPPVPRLDGNAERGKALVGSVGCIACHSIADFPHPEGGVANDHGPELSTVGSKATKEWLYRWLKEPKHYFAETRMPSLRLTDQEAMDAATYLSSLKAPADSAWAKEEVPALSDAMVRTLAIEAMRVGKTPGIDVSADVEAMTPEQRLRAVGARAITRYGCFGCHDIPGFDLKDRVGTQLGGEEGWGSKDPDRLDFGVLEDPKAVAKFADAWGAKRLPHRRPEWAMMKMLNPRVFDAGLAKQPHERLQMPNFNFTEDEAEAVVTFLLSLQKTEIVPARRPRPDVRELDAERLRWLVRQYNCYGCHTVDRHEVVGSDGTREWVARGGDIRPWLLDADGRANKDAWPPTLGGEGRGRNENECKRQATLLENAGLDAKGEPAKAVPPARVVRPWEWPNAIGEGTKARPEWLFRFLHDPGRQVLRPWLATRMPTFPLTEAELNAIVRGFAAADRVPFPYVLANEKPMTPAERTDAEALFKALQCSSCHPASGAAVNPSAGGLAPDLALAHDRLRREWVRLWLDDPARLQPGTRMPPFWRSGDYPAPPPGLPKRFFPAPSEFEEGDPRRDHGDALLQMEKVTDYVLGIGAPKSAPR